ncbi:Rha family transcriptional regulator [Marinobacter sp.]|uniref:Rha family transcriptional regulator n=1 Tax=Marinobacter sp. TaxID=50741 RepID=UPI003A944B28
MNIERIKATGYVTTLNGLPGMSSQEIAEITGKKHLHVLRDIRRMLDALKINPNLDTSLRCIETQAPDRYERLQPLTILDKELTFTLLSRYSFDISNLIVKRWLALEGSGFERVPVQAAVVHLIEREKDNFREAMKALKRSPQSQSPAAKAHRQRKAQEAKLDAQIRRNANAEARKARQQGREYI